MPFSPNLEISIERLLQAPLDRLEAELDRRERLQRSGEVEASRKRCRTLVGFVREAWHILEPGNEYVHGWHISAICQHLQAVTAGKITRLLINVPPGFSKSLLVGVFWPSWEWGPAGLPHLRYLTTSYTDTYVKRDSRKMRDLVMSEWYQERWPQTALVRWGETSFENAARGGREGVPFKSLTGGRGDRVLIDDPHSTEGAESDLDRQTAIRIFRESVPTRLNKPDSSAIVIIMQRLHVEDVAGVALSLGLGYVHLCLPMEFEPERRCHTVIGFKDPRTIEGELLFPQRFPKEVVARDKIPMGSFAVAGQFQQRPTLRGGGLFKREWFKKVKAVPAGTRFVRGWDLASTEEQVGATAAYTAGVKLGRQTDGRFIIADVARLRAEGLGVRRLIKETARDDGHQVEIALPQDPGSAGKVVAKSLILDLAGYIVRAEPETGDKLTRAEPLAAQAEAGNVDILEGSWNEIYLDELCDFPAGKCKDQVDASSLAFSRLIGSSMFSALEADIREDAVRVQSIWARIAAIEIDAARVGMVWAAHDRTTDTVHIYDAVAGPRSDLAVIAAAMRDRGIWIPTLIDLEGGKRKEPETVKIAERLAELQCTIMTATVEPEAALEEMAIRLSSRRLRVFDPLSDWFAEYRRFRRDDKGQIVLQDSHIMRATAVLLSHLACAVTENQAASDARGYRPEDYGGPGNATGY